MSQLVVEQKCYASMLLHPVQRLQLNRAQTKEFKKHRKKALLVFVLHPYLL